MERAPNRKDPETFLPVARALHLGIEYGTVRADECQ